MDSQLLRRTVLLFYNRSHMSFCIAENPSVSERIVHDCRQDSRGAVMIPARTNETFDRFPAQKRCIPANHKHIPVTIIFKQRNRLHHRMGGSQLFLLMDEINIFSGKPFTNKFLFESRDNHTFFRSCLFYRTNDLLRHRDAANFVQNFRPLRLHSCTLACSQNDRRQTLHIASRRFLQRAYIFRK